MFSIIWPIKAWQTSDCYAALLLTVNSYTRLLSVRSLSPHLSISRSPFNSPSLLLRLTNSLNPLSRCHSDLLCLTLP